MRMIFLYRCTTCGFTSKQETYAGPTLDLPHYEPDGEKESCSGFMLLVNTQYPEKSKQ